MEIKCSSGVPTDHLRELIHAAPGKNILVTFRSGIDEHETTTFQELFWIPYESIEEIYYESYQSIKVTFYEGELVQRYFDHILFIGDINQWAKDQKVKINYNFNV